MTRRAGRVMKVVLAVAALYVGGVALLFALQRSMLFPAPRPARDVAYAGGELLRIPRADGPPAVAFHLAPPSAPWTSGERARTVVHFHGNGEQLADNLRLAVALHREAGVGYFGVEYPGYGVAEGTPSEDAILSAARAAVHHLVSARGVAEEDLVILGQSLGSGAATALAHDGLGRRLALLTPFTSVTDAAAHHFPWLPVRWLVKDRFDNLSRAPEVKVPVLIIHGTSDGVVPYAHGEKLSQAFPNARLLTVHGAGHNDLFTHEGVRDALFRFLAAED